MHDLTYQGHVDLKNCEDEPIHLLGRLQSHGTLLGFNSKLELTHFSASSQFLFKGKDPLQESLSLVDILGEKAHTEAKQFLKSDQSVLFVIDNLFTINERPYRISWFKSSDSTIHAELEPADTSGKLNIIPALSELHEFQQRMELFSSEIDVAAQVVRSFRRLTNFDRVMFYKFDYNGDGEVIAEDRVRGLESFLGLRYPATDIPPQARKLYLINKTRSIYDVHDEGVPIYGLQSEKPLDLTHSIYRSVSPIHLEYLRNMGVTATHANSIIKEGKLWGMIICHHYESSKHLSFTSRILTSFYADIIQNWLSNTKLQKNKERSQRQHHVLERIMSDRKSLTIHELLSDRFELIQEVLGIDGFSCISETQTLHKGHYLKEPLEVTALIQELKDCAQQGKCQIYHEDNLDFSIQQDCILGGVAGFYAGLTEDHYIFFYRKEKKEIYRWAGKPHTQEEAEQRLSPRKSFELWQETVKGKSMPWTEDDKAFIRKLINALDVFEASKVQSSGTLAPQTLRVSNLKKEIATLQRDKTQIEQELHELKQKTNQSHHFQDLKSVLLSNMSHEMRTPLNGIIGLADLIEHSEETTEEIKTYSQLISESGYRMLKTFNSLMSLDLLQLQKEETGNTWLSLQAFFEDLLGPIVTHLAKGQQNLLWRIHNHREKLFTNDRLLGQIIINLVNNALKYGGPKVTVQIDVRVLFVKEAKKLLIEVEDDGPGIPKTDHAKIFEPFYMGENVTRQKDEAGGLGLYIVKTYVEFLEGTISLESAVGKGTKFLIQIPIETK